MVAKILKFKNKYKTWYKKNNWKKPINIKECYDHNMKIKYSQKIKENGSLIKNK